MSYKFSVVFEKKEHMIYVISMEKSSYSKKQKYTICIDKEKDNIDLSYINENGNFEIDVKSAGISNALINCIWDELRKQPEFPDNFPGLDRVKFPIPE